MREVASKAATGESTAGLLKIMDQIAGLNAPRSLPPIAAGGYRVLEHSRDRQRQSVSQGDANQPGPTINGFRCGDDRADTGKAQKKRPNRFRQNHGPG